MKSEILNEIENKLFSRKEVTLKVNADIPPSKEKAIEIVAEQFKVKSNCVRIRKIDSRFGSRNFLIIADIYDSEDEFKRIVRKTKKEIEDEIKKEEAKKKEIEEQKKAEEEKAKEAQESSKENDEGEKTE